MRPIDLARRHGLSTQAVRNYEEAGVLPPAARSGSGYRRYSRRHALALDAFVALVRGHGHPAARTSRSLLESLHCLFNDTVELVDAPTTRRSRRTAHDQPHSPDQRRR